MCYNNSIFQEKDYVQLAFDSDKGRNVYSVILNSGKKLNTHYGKIEHDDLIGAEPGIQLTSPTGVNFRVFLPTISEATLSFPRGAAIIYPKDAAAIITYGDIYPGAKVLECGLGSGALTCYLLRAVGEFGQITSLERREDFLKTGRSNVTNFFGNEPANWRTELSELADFLSNENSLYDRGILDLLNPWEFLESMHQRLIKGAVLTCYITTTTQMQSLSEEFAQLKDKYCNIECMEIIRRPWHLDGLSTRPEHQGIMHSGFILTARTI